MGRLHVICIYEKTNANISAGKQICVQGAAKLYVKCFHFHYSENSSKCKPVKSCRKISKVISPIGPYADQTSFEDMTDQEKFVPMIVA
jgi:hypothetical protein